MKKAATPGCFCPDGRLILVILHVVIHFRQLYDLSRIDYTFSPSSLSIRTKVINALGILSPKGQRVPLAASTHDNSPASSRSLTCSKPVTSLSLAALCIKNFYIYKHLCSADFKLLRMYLKSVKLAMSCFMARKVYILLANFRKNICLSTRGILSPLGRKTIFCLSCIYK